MALGRHRVSAPRLSAASEGRGLSFTQAQSAALGRRVGLWSGGLAVTSQVILNTLTLEQLARDAATHERGVPTSIARVNRRPTLADSALHSGITPSLAGQEPLQLKRLWRGGADHRYTRRGAVSSDEGLCEGLGGRSAARRRGRRRRHGGPRPPGGTRSLRVY